MRNQSITVIGDGGLAKQIKDVVNSITTYSISCGGRVQINGFVCGEFINLKTTIPASDPKFIIGFAALQFPEQREATYNEIIHSGGKFATIIAPTAIVSQDASIGEGGVILHGAFVGPDANLDVNVLVCTKAIVEHDSRIGQHTSILTGAIINGDCNIGCYCVVGSGAVILQGINICDDVVIGANSTVTKDIIESGTYVGCPARKVK